MLQDIYSVIKEAMREFRRLRWLRQRRADYRLFDDSAPF